MGTEDEVEDGSHDSTFRDACYGIEEYLNDLPESTLAIPGGYIAMTDIIHELSRRIRSAHNIPEYPTKGISIKNEDGSLKTLVHPPLRKDSPLSQEIVNRVTNEAYALNPELMFAAAEQSRRDISTAVVESHIINLLKTITEEHNVPYSFEFDQYLLASLSYTTLGINDKKLSSLEPSG